MVGSTTCDLVDGKPPRPGGAPLYAARVLASLSVAATVVTRCARADTWLVDAVSAAGVEVVWHPSSATPSFRIENRAGEREMTIEVLAEPWTAADVAAALPAHTRLDWIQVAPLWRGEFEAAALSALAARGRVCLDGQGLARPGRVGRVTLDDSFDRGLLVDVSALHISQAELAALGLSTTAASLATLGVPEIIVTLGERGSVIWADGRAEAVPAEPVSGADPTGAGDAFTALYLAARSTGGAPVDAAREAMAAVRVMLEERAEKGVA